ncbi:MAG: M20/M25/M40 family metallo-hydrolase [Cyclobacteriaceae bacterium]|nr:M20/M25/M40 family metallo-hydrolase [Cyclobacteriaceae bacterium]
MRSLITIVLTFCLSVSWSQSVEKIIKEKDVSRIISKLASDEMRGRSALSPTDIDKAAAFIEKEFQKAKLKPLPGVTSYRQRFQQKRISLEKLAVVINGVNLPDSVLIFSSTKETVDMDASATIDSIGAGQNLFLTIGAMEKKPGNKVVFVAPEHAENFNTAKHYLGRPKIIGVDERTESTSLYILGRLQNTDGLNAEARQKVEILNMSNVVGMIEGKSRKDEFVVFSGHYDHIGIQAAVEGDSIANGADDDASGTTAVITLAKYYSKLKSNERSLIFVAFTAEEVGGFGSKYFSQQLDPNQVIAMFNIEMIGKPSLWGTNSAFITGFDKSSLGEILEKNVQGTPFHFYPDPYIEQNLFYRSDNATLARLGVPAHSISTDQIPSDPYYHTVNDEVETLDIANIVSTIRAIAAGAASIVSGQDTPTRIDPAKVK